MKNLFITLIFTTITFSLHAQVVNSYEIYAEFFPDNAQMYSNAVSPDAFIRVRTVVEFSDLADDDFVFYLHGELKIDSIIAGNNNIEFSSEKVLYDYNYSLVALKVTIKSANISSENVITIYYSGFFNPSRASSLSDYMHINKNEGVFLRAYGYSLWFPVFINSGQESYKANFKNITIKLPADYKCIVGGKLVNEFVKNDIYTVVWKPGLTAIIDIQCTARKYKIISGDNVFIYYLSGKSGSEKILDFAVKLKKLYSENLRRTDETLPLYIMEMPKYGDISSGNVIGISEEYFNSFDNNIRSKLIIAHELVHPFVKIPVSTDNPFCAFVIEGFPSFFQVYALERVSDDSVYNLKDEMKKVEKSYLQKRETGKTRRGNPLPVEKPILNMTFDDIGNYKDKFVLNDRVWLFFYDIWNKIGDDKFDGFLKKLFSLDSINYEVFEKLILSYIPDYKEKLNIWLKTTNYPEEIHLLK